jgi:hypothetical protein
MKGIEGPMLEALFRLGQRRITRSAVDKKEIRAMLSVKQSSFTEPVERRNYGPI